jgi:hypothetical protein
VSFAYIAAYGVKKKNDGPRVVDADSLRDDIRKEWRNGEDG